MPNKVPSTTPAQPQKVVCQICGKTLTKATAQKAGQGSRCQHIASKFTPAQMQAHYKAHSVAAIPKGFIKVAALDKAVKANKHKVPGLTISKMVAAMGRDRASNPPVNPIAKPYYLPNRHRVIHAWLATPAGLNAIATGQWDKAPKAPVVKTI